MYPSLSGNVPHLLSTSSWDTTWPTHWLPEAARSQGLSQHAPCASALLLAPRVRYTGHGEFRRRVSLTLYIILMFYCIEIRKAPNMLSCQCETWRGAFVCMGMAFAECLRRPAYSVCLARRWKVSTCVITLLCRGSLTSVAPCLKTIWLQTFETFILEDCVYLC